VKNTFKGGVHPHEGKELTEHISIAPFGNPAQIAMLMSQHIGAICLPTVSKRQEVKAGEVIGASEAFVSAKIHSPVNGIVKDVCLWSHPVLGRVQAVIIDVAEGSAVKAQPQQSIYADFDIETYSDAEILAAIKECGIVGMGGAGFPTNVKVGPNPQMPKETMIVNACECEPYITCDYRVMLEWTKQFIAGVRLIKKASQCRTCYIGIEENKPEAIKLLTDELADCDDITVVSVKTKYPQGGERQLINAVLGVVVPTGKIPPMIGVLVCNVATAAATAEAVIEKKPLTHRVVTVTGLGIKKPANLYIPVGTPVSALIDFCGGLTGDTVKVVLGGPMMGFSIGELSMPITKTTGSVLCLTRKEIGMAKFLGRQTSCIRCSRCLTVCPERLNPTKIAHCVKADKLDLAEANNISACMECGCCSYVCPANIELAGYIKTGKIRIARAKQQKKA
jgi:electron transport complex protein RnfC